MAKTSNRKRPDINAPWWSPSLWHVCPTNKSNDGPIQMVAQTCHITVANELLGCFWFTNIEYFTAGAKLLIPHLHPGNAATVGPHLPICEVSNLFISGVISLLTTCDVCESTVVRTSHHPLHNDTYMCGLLINWHHKGSHKNL